MVVGTEAAGDPAAAPGVITADVVVVAMGTLSEPRTPDIAGIDGFAGTIFHSAAWDHDHDLAGERVAVIGTGASSIQFVPEIQLVAGHVDVYQRTPPWVDPPPRPGVPSAGDGRVAGGAARAAGRPGRDRPGARAAVLRAPRPGACAASSASPSPT